MPNTCSVYGCHARGGRDVGVSFYLIPAVIMNQGDATRELCSRRREAWIASINRKDWHPTKHSRVCSSHFISGVAIV